MKKIIAFSVLLALLSAAVFAQDGSGWKIGFTAQLTRDFFYSTKASGETETKIVSNPANTSSDGTFTGKLGDYIKGSSNIFTFTDSGRRPDNRLIVSLSNSGEHHNVYIDVKLDDSWLKGFTFMDLINGDAADWWFAGDTGGLDNSVVVFDGKVGTGRYGGFVPVYELWDDWLQLGDYNFFGVQEIKGFQPSNNMSNTDMDYSPWNPVYAIGATFGGNFRFAVGSTFGWGRNFNPGYDNPVASASSTEAGFMLSGRNIADILTFDVFYAINGKDKNTVMRGTGSWNNLLGVYAGLNIVENLGLSVGYTASFVKNETAEEAGTTGKLVPYEITDPIWSGVDIKVKYDGIDKLGITFNNNVSFASAQGVEFKNAGDTRIIGLSGSGLGKDQNENWFAYNAILGVNYALSDHLGVTFALGNLLGVFSTDSETSTTVIGITTTSTSTSKTTNNELRASLHAEYTVGNITVGLGLNLGLETLSYESETKSATSGSGYSSSSTTTTTGSLSTVKFGVPLFFKVAI